MGSYTASLTFIFFLASILNTCFYIHRLKQVSYQQIGTVKFLVLQGLILMAFFNMPYKIFFDVNGALYDTFINSLTETFMLFLNLVLSHGMYASPSISKKAFYLPKVTISIAMFFCLWAWSYADVQEFIAYKENDFVID